MPGLRCQRADEIGKDGHFSMVHSPKVRRLRALFIPKQAKIGRWFAAAWPAAAAAAAHVISQFGARTNRTRSVLLRTMAVMIVFTSLTGTAVAAGAVSEPYRSSFWMVIHNCFDFCKGCASRLDTLIDPGPVRDVLALLFATALAVPGVRKMNTSPILGFLAMGVILGPSGLHIVQNLTATSILAEIGIVFFLFEMGLELSIEKVWSMKFDVFVLGAAQYFITGAIIAFVASWVSPSLKPEALLVLGGALALSSSAFVLQLIRDKNQLGTRFGKIAFGVLLFQDLAVVPLLVVVPLLSGAAGGGSLIGALGQAGARAVLALGIIFVFGHFLLDRIFLFVTSSRSPEAFLSATLGAVMLCASITEDLGLSSSLGAFLGGVLLSETHYKHQVEADVAPFRGLLLGLFFVTVGFSIDLRLLASAWYEIIPIIAALLVIKIVVVGGVCQLTKQSGTSSIQAATLLAPGGEFAFVVFGLAQKLMLLDENTTKVFVSATAISMALIPVLGKLGEKVAIPIRRRRGIQSFAGKDEEVTKIVEQAAKSEKGFVVVCGYGLIGRTICSLLDTEGDWEYVVFENNPIKAITARASGLPVFLADCSRREVLEKFKVGEAKLVIIAMGQKKEANNVAGAISRYFPDVPILVRALDDEHQQHLLRSFGLDAVVPTLPPDSVMLSLPFGAEVLRRLGYDETEVELLQEEVRRHVYAEGGMSEVSGTDKALRDVFQRFDKDGNGCIDVEDLGKMFESLGQPCTDDQLGRLLSTANLKGASGVTFDRFKQLVKESMFQN